MSFEQHQQDIEGTTADADGLAALGQKPLRAGQPERAK